MKKLHYCIFLCIMFFSAQLGAQKPPIDEEFYQYLPNYKTQSAVSFIPTLLVNSGVGLEGVFAYKKNNAVAIQLVFIESPYINDSRVLDNQRQPYNGFAANINNRLYLNELGVENSRTYLDFGLHFSSILFRGVVYKWITYPPDPQFLSLEKVEEPYTIPRVGINIIAGREVRLNEHFYLDIFGGFIYRYSWSNLDVDKFINNREFPNDQLGFAFTGANFTCGIKLGVFFK